MAWQSSYKRGQRRGEARNSCVGYCQPCSPLPCSHCSTLQRTPAGALGVGMRHTAVILLAESNHCDAGCTWRHQNALQEP